VAVKRFQSSRGLYPDGKVTSLAARQMGLRGTPPPSGAPRITVIGDSTSAAMRWYDEANNLTAIYDIMGNSYDVQWSIESCRRLVAPSCVGRLDPGQGIRWTPVSVLPLMQTTMRGRIGNALVVMAGYDDSPRLNDDIDRIVTEAERQGVTRVFWLTYRTTSVYHYGSFYLSHNRDLAAARTRHPNLVVLDWNAYTHQQSAGTQGAWFERDGIHMTRSGATALANFLKRAVDTSDVAACRAPVAHAGTTADPAGNPAVNGTPAGFVPITPVRVFDSRIAALGGGNGKVLAGRKVAIDLSTRIAGATGAVVNITATNPCAAGGLIAYPCGTRPSGLQVQFESGRTTTGMAITAVKGTSLCVHTTATTDLSVDVIGTFAPSGTLYHPRQLIRWLDTRGNSAVVGTRGVLNNGAALTVKVAGLGGVPAAATAAWLNVTAVAPGSRGALTVLPGACSGAAGRTTSVSVHSGRAAASASLVQLTGGNICIRATGGPLHVVIDLAGWFGGPTAGGLMYRPETPSRAFSSKVSGGLAPGVVRTFTTPPNSVLIVTATASASSGYVSAKACGVTAITSLLNTAWSENTANIGVVPGGTGTVCLSSSSTTGAVADRVGRFVSPPG
jgi:hypothetical protein